MHTVPQPIGYEWLRRQYALKAMPHFRSSFVSNRWERHIHREGGREEHLLPISFAPEPTLGAHLEFALKYEGAALDLLSALFDVVTENDVAAAVQEKPTGQYRRRLWYLYEFLTGKKLKLPDLRMGSYVPLLDEKLYFVPHLIQRSPRHRINVNLWGGSSFSPLVRRTERLVQMQERRFDQQARAAVKQYPADVLARAVSYLYTKETKSSFQIEHEEPDARRSARFVELLRLAEKRSFWTRESLLELQNAIVDPRFLAKDYRDFQNYVGETRPFGDELIHYVCPRPEDVASLMQGLFDAQEAMSRNGLDPVLMAAMLSFAFVFVHPFEDGNGRIHRFLIHNVLARAGYAPEGMIFPVSASMLQQMKKYDETLEAFSAPLLPLLEWKLDADGNMAVIGQTARHYRYIDFTEISERLYDFVADTVEHQLPDELDLLVRYDAAKRAVRDIVDMPDRLIDLFVKICAGNRGRLSHVKRKSHFSMLTDDEIASMEKGVEDALGGVSGAGS